MKNICRQVNTLSHIKHQKKQVNFIINHGIGSVILHQCKPSDLHLQLQEMFMDNAWHSFP